MFIDCSKLPDPLNPVVDDVYTSPGAAHTVVVTMSPYRCDDGNSERYYIRAVRDGTPIAFDADAFVGLYVSLGLRPWGRLDRSAATRPAITRDPELVDQRLTAFGPHLRALREQYGLSMGDLARALGCTGVRLSGLELAQPDPVREGPGVQEDEGRAALAELLAETAARVYVIHRAEGSGSFEADVWQEVHGMLATKPAHAAMATILKARSAANIAANPGTSAWHQPEVIDPPGVFRLGDRVLFGADDTPGKVTELDQQDPTAVWVKFETMPPGIPDDGTNVCCVGATEIKLANENVAVQTARAGLALLAASAVGEGFERPFDHAVASMREAWVPTFERLFATDEAQRLIRLHG